MTDKDKQELAQIVIDNALEILQDNIGVASVSKISALHQLKKLQSHQLLQSQKKEIINVLNQVMAEPDRPGYELVFDDYSKFVKK